MYRIENITKIYSQGEQSVTALCNLNLEFEKRGIITITGDSGSGKTTLLNVLAGFDKVSEGEIYFEEKRMSLLTEDAWNSYLNEDIGFVFQDFNVIEELSVWDNVGLALEILNIDTEKKLSMIESILNMVGIYDIKDKIVKQLSGGQKQRVAIARAYVKQPKVILADEPTGNLDYYNSIKIFEMLKDISKDILVIIITHNQNLAEKYSDRIIKMSDGEIISDNKIENVRYNVRIINNEGMKKVETFNDIINYTKYNPSVNNEYVLKIEKEDIDSTNEEKDIKVREVYSKQRMSNSKIATLEKKILSKRRVRRIMSIGIFTITIFLLLLLTTFIFYNENTVITEYLDKYNEKEVIVERELESIYKYSDNSTVAYITKDMKQDLYELTNDNVFYQYDSVVFSSSNGMMGYDDVYTGKNFDVVAVARVVSDKILKEYYRIDGLEGNEVVVTDKLAKEVGISEKNIGDMVYINGREVVLKEIATYAESLIILSEEYPQHLQNVCRNNSISVGGNFLDSKSLFEYANTYIAIKNIETAEYANIKGNIPQQKSEALISYDYACKNLDIENVEDIIGNTYSLKDLYSSRYGDALTEKMNLYDYMGGSVTVVGVAEFDGDVCVTSNVFNEISNEYYNIYAYDKMGCYCEEWGDVINEFHKQNFRICDENIKNVYMIVDMKPVVIKYIVFILAIMVIMTIFLMVSLISYSIKDNSKLIGIFKAIGIDNNDVKKIFVIEPIRIIISTFTMAVILLIIMVNYINTEYCNMVNAREYDILPFNIVAMVIAIVITMVVGTIAIILPIRDMEKQTIIEVIKE